MPDHRILRRADATGSAICRRAYAALASTFRIRSEVSEVLQTASGAPGLSGAEQLNDRKPARDDSNSYPLNNYKNVHARRGRAVRLMQFTRGHGPALFEGTVEAGAVQAA